MIKNDKALHIFDFDMGVSMYSSLHFYNPAKTYSAMMDFTATEFRIVPGNEFPHDLLLDCGNGKTLELEHPVYDDMRITPSSFDRPGVSDPTIVKVQPGGSGDTYLYEFADGNAASFVVQLPHTYKVGEDIKVHVHWTPGDHGEAEDGNTVGWKIDYTWANINGAFGEMTTADCSDACNGVDWEHNMSPEVTITGTGKSISSMLICNIRRTDTGSDDTWNGTVSGERPLILEVDFHYPVNTLGSRTWSTK